MEECKNQNQNHDGFAKDKKNSEKITATIILDTESYNFQAKFDFKYKPNKTVYDIIYAWVKKENNESMLDIFTKQIVIENNTNKVKFDTLVSSLLTAKGIELKISQESNLERTESISVKVLDNTDMNSFTVSPDISMKDLRLLVSLYCKNHIGNIGLSSTYHIYDDNDTVSSSGALGDGFILAFWIQLCSKRKNY